MISRDAFIWLILIRGPLLGIVENRPVGVGTRIVWRKAIPSRIRRWRVRKVPFCHRLGWRVVITALGTLTMCLLPVVRGLENTCRGCVGRGSVPFGRTRLSTTSRWSWCRRYIRFLPCRQALPPAVRLRFSAHALRAGGDGMGDANEIGAVSSRGRTEASPQLRTRHEGVGANCESGER